MLTNHWHLITSIDLERGWDQFVSIILRNTRLSPDSAPCIAWPWVGPSLSSALARDNTMTLIHHPLFLRHKLRWSEISGGCALYRLIIYLGCHKNLSAVTLLSSSLLSPGAIHPAMARVFRDWSAAVWRAGPGYKSNIYSNRNIMEH